jgi:hypothetical protein
MYAWMAAVGKNYAHLKINNIIENFNEQTQT